MFTRSKTTVLQSLFQLKSNTIEMNNHMNIVSLYYKSDNNNNHQSVIKLCLNDEQLNKIKHKKIIIYKNKDYDYAELLDYEKIKYDKQLEKQLNNGNEHIIKSIENNLLDDVTFDMLVEDDDIEAAKILLDIKNN
jgi:hypothetical protein